MYKKLIVARAKGVEPLELPLNPPLIHPMIVNIGFTQYCNVFLTPPLSGDLVQLGSTTVFRFNHPEELAEMKHYSEV